MKRLTLVLTAVAAVIVVQGISGVPAFAKRAFHNRAERQHARIKQGVRSGQLTKEEAQGLRQEQRDIHEARKAARVDGNVTPQERQNLQQMRNKASKDIYQQKHDGEVKE